MLEALYKHQGYNVEATEATTSALRQLGQLYKHPEVRRMLIAYPEGPEGCVGGVDA